MISLCPKTTFALLGIEKAEFSDIPLDGKMSYMDACLHSKEKVKIIGENCIKNLNYNVNGKIKGVNLL